MFTGKGLLGRFKLEPHMYVMEESVFLLLKAAPEKSASLYNRLRENGEKEGVVYVHGIMDPEYDLLAKVSGKSIESVQAYIERNVMGEDVKDLKVVGWATA